MFYDTSSTYREAYGKFFRSGTLLPDGSSSVPFFRLRSFCSFYFLFLVCFLFARARLNNNPAKVFPAVKYPLFRCSVYLFGVATVFFLFFPCTHSGQVEQASMVLRRRPFHHKDDDIREALPATLSSPKCSWSSSEIWTIFTTISFDHPTLSGPKQGLWLTACSWFPFHAEKETSK